MPKPDKGFDPSMSERELAFRLGAICGLIGLGVVITLVWLVTGEWPDYCR